MEKEVKKGENGSHEREVIVLDNNISLAVVDKCLWRYMSSGTTYEKAIRMKYRLIDRTGLNNKEKGKVE